MEGAGEKGLPLVIGQGLLRGLLKALHLFDRKGRAANIIGIGASRYNVVPCPLHRRR